MRICRVTHTVPRDTSPGAGLHPYRLCDLIKEPTLVLTRRLPGTPFRFPPHVCLQEINFPHKRLPRLEGLSALGMAEKLWVAGTGQMLFAIKSLPVMRAFRPSIVHLHGALGLFVGLMAKYVLGAKFAVTVIGTDFERLRATTLLQRILSHADLVFYVAHSMRADLDRILPSSRVAYCGTGVDTALFQPGHLRRRSQIIAVGRMEWQKGFEHLIDATAIVSKKRSDVQLILIGDGTLAHSLRQRVRDLGLSSQVRFAGVLARPKVAHLMQRSRLFVSSSILEGTPKALLEAIACGTPVVMTDVGDCALIAKEVGLVVPPADPRALADAILRLLDDDVLWNRYSLTARGRAKSYAWSNVAQLVMNGYQSILEQRGRDKCV